MADGGENHLTNDKNKSLLDDTGKATNPPTTTAPTVAGGPTANTDQTVRIETIPEPTKASSTPIHTGTVPKTAYAQRRGMLPHYFYEQPNQHFFDSFQYDQRGSSTASQSELASVTFALAGLAKTVQDMQTALQTVKAGDANRMAAANTTTTTVSTLQTVSAPTAVMSSIVSSAPSTVENNLPLPPPFRTTEMSNATLIQPHYYSGLYQNYSHGSPRLNAPSAVNPLARVTPSKITSKHTEHSFHQLESWLALNGYTRDDDKFNALKVFIEPETYDIVANLIYSPPPNNKYETLKSAIIKAFTDSETKNIHKLLSGLQLGDRRPSQLLTEMSKLYKGPKDKIFRELFLARLPPNVRGILVAAPQQDERQPMSIEALAQWTDNIIEQTSSSLSISAISEHHSSSQTSKLQAQVNELTKKLNELCANRSRSRSRSRSNSASRGNATDSTKMCFYHKKFGNGQHANRKCKEGCPLHDQWLAHNNRSNSKNSKSE